MPGEIPNEFLPKETTKNLDGKIKDIKDVLSSEKPPDNEEYKYMGGSYGDLKWEYSGHGDKYEVHHIPANSASDLPKSDGPAIAMDRADHALTASFDSSKEAKEYQKAQKELIAQGKFFEAFQMDVDDIHEKFGDKYDKAIAQALEYAKKIKGGDHA